MPTVRLVRAPLPVARHARLESIWIHPRLANLVRQAALLALVLSLAQAAMQTGLPIVPYAILCVQATSTWS